MAAIVENIKKSIQVPLILIGICWAVEIIELLFNSNFNRFGILPRSINGLIGIATSPFVHGGFFHLISNTLPFVILGTAIILFYRKIYIQVYLLCFLATGFGVWLLARPVYHIGASGVVYAFAGFLLFMGIFKRSIKAILISVAMIILYGGLIFGVFPGRPGISWESHLIGAVVGAGIAYLYSKTKTE